MKDSNNSEMKPASLKQIQFKIKQLQIRQATTDEDYRGADVFVNDLAVAHRKRNIKLEQYNEISIRKRDKSESEYEKILGDKCLAKMWIFEFTDVFVICLTVDIKKALVEKKGNYVPNKSEPNGAFYIHLSQIPHLRIEK